MLLTRSSPKGDLQEFMESLLWVSTGYEPVYNLSKATKNLLYEVKSMLKDSIFHERSSILDSLYTTFRIYTMLDDQMGPLSMVYILKVV